MLITMELRSSHRSRLGFTLVEVMVGALLGGFVLAGVLVTNLQLMRSGLRITQYAEMSTQTRRGLEQLSADLKSASAIHFNNPADITLTIPTSAGSTRQVTYAWTSATQSLFMVAGASSSVTVGRVYLVNGVAAVTFSRYDRDGNVATTNLATKRVRVSITASRSAKTAATATDTAISATFILRNKPTSQ